MTDTVTRQRRAEIMRSVKGKDTKPEIIVRQYLHKAGLRFRLHDKKLPERPDVKLTKKNLFMEMSNYISDFYRLFIIMKTINIIFNLTQADAKLIK